MKFCKQIKIDYDHRLSHNVFEINPNYVNGEMDNLMTYTVNKLFSLFYNREKMQPENEKYNTTQ